MGPPVDLETIQRTGRTLNIGGALPMPAGTTTEEMATMLRFWVSRHPSLRTRLRFAPHPQQVVAESGELPLHVVDVDGADDPAAAAESLRVEFEMPHFDYAKEFPVRMGVVRRGGEVTHMVVQYCHLAVDGGGIDAMVRDLENLDRDTGEGGSPANALTPLELARIQSTPAGLRPSDKSLRYWREQLHDVPSRRFAEPGEGCEPRFWELCLYSPAMYLALKSIAARTETNTTHVLFAAYAVALAQVTGIQPSLAMTVVSNRFRPGLGDLVGQISQPGLCVVRVADCTARSSSRWIRRLISMLRDGSRSRTPSWSRPYSSRSGPIPGICRRATSRISSARWSGSWCVRPWIRPR